MREDAGSIVIETSSVGGLCRFDCGLLFNSHVDIPSFPLRYFFISSIAIIMPMLEVFTFFELTCFNGLFSFFFFKFYGVRRPMVAKNVCLNKR